MGSTVTTVGFGLNGLGREGRQFTRDGQRWAAENILDWIGGAPFPEGATQSNSAIFARDNAAQSNGDILPGTFNIFTTDFDDGTALNNTLSDFGSSPFPLTNEGTTASGDSGGPLLVKHKNEFLIAGVLSGGTTFNSVFGDISWWTGSEQHRSFIEQRGGQFVSTPEALSPFALMLLGAGGASVAWMRRRLSD